MVGHDGFDREYDDPGVEPRANAARVEYRQKWPDLLGGARAAADVASRQHQHHT
jgi:hypothetical protein